MRREHHNKTAEGSLCSVNNRRPLYEFSAYRTRRREAQPIDRMKGRTFRHQASSQLTCAIFVSSNFKSSCTCCATSSSSSFEYSSTGDGVVSSCHLLYIQEHGLITIRPTHDASRQTELPSEASDSSAGSSHLGPQLCHTVRESSAFPCLRSYHKHRHRWQGSTRSKPMDVPWVRGCACTLGWSFRRIDHSFNGTGKQYKTRLSTTGD